MKSFERFDFDAAVERFFSEFPEKSKDIFVAPGNAPRDIYFKYPEILHSAYEEFCRENGHDHTAMVTTRQCYPDAPCVYPAGKKGDGTQTVSILPRWHDFSTTGDMASFLYALKHFDYGPDIGAGDFAPLSADACLMWNEFQFNHEIAHLLSHDRLPPRNPLDPDCIATVISENVSDVYGMMRHYQKYGRESFFGDDVLKWRKINLIQFMDHAHYTVPALEKVIECGRRGDFEALTPQQCFDAALKIGSRHFLHTDMNKVFERNFSKLFKKRRNRKSPLGTPQLEMISDIGARTRFHAVRDACLAYMDWAEHYFPKKITGAFDFQTARDHINRAGPKPKGRLRILAAALFSAKSGPVKSAPLQRPAF